MIPRPPLRYESSRQIVRLAAFGFRVPLPVLLYAKSQLPSEPVIEYRTVEDDESYFADADGHEWQDRQEEYWDMLKR